MFEDNPHVVLQFLTTWAHACWRTHTHFFFFFGNHIEVSENFAVPSSVEEDIAYEWGNRSSTGYKYLDFPGFQHITNKFLLLISYQPIAFCYSRGNMWQGLTSLEALWGWTNLNPTSFSLGNTRKENVGFDPTKGWDIRASGQKRGIFGGNRAFWWT